MHVTQSKPRLAYLCLSTFGSAAWHEKQMWLLLAMVVIILLIIIIVPIALHAKNNSDKDDR